MREGLRARRERSGRAVRPELVGGRVERRVRHHVGLPVHGHTHRRAPDALNHGLLRRRLPAGGGHRNGSNVCPRRPRGGERTMATRWRQAALTCTLLGLTASSLLWRREVSAAVPVPGFAPDADEPRVADDGAFAQDGKGDLSAAEPAGVPELVSAAARASPSIAARNATSRRDAALPKRSRPRAPRPTENVPDHSPYAPRRPADMSYDGRNGSVIFRARARGARGAGGAPRGRECGRRWPAAAGVRRGRGHPRAPRACACLAAPRRAHARSTPRVRLVRTQRLAARARARA